MNNGIKNDLDSLFYSITDKNLILDYNLALKSLNSYNYVNFNNTLESLKNKFGINKQVEIIFLQALHSFNHSKYDSALCKIELALSIDSINFDCNVLKGEILFKIKNIEAAIIQLQFCNGLTNENKNKSWVLNIQGNYYTTLKSYTKALDAYTLSLSYAIKAYEPNDTNLAIINGNVSNLYSLMAIILRQFVIQKKLMILTNMYIQKTILI